MCCMYIEEESGWTNGSACFYEKSIQWRENSRMKNQSFQEEVQHLEIVQDLMEQKSGDREKPIARTRPGYR